MNQKCKNGFVKRLRNETHPLQVLLNDQTLACFIPDAKMFPGFSGVARLLGFPTTGHDNSGFENMPTLTPSNPDNDLVTLGNHSSIRHPSAFFLLVLRTGKPSAVSMTRWLTREVVPKSAIFKAPLAAITDDLELKRLIGRPKSRMAGQIMVNLEIVKASDGKPSLSIADADILVEGGEQCRKP